MITLTGGEPLLHPKILQIVERVRSRNVFAEMLTNAYLLTPSLIQDLNRAGLERMQISIDNVAPDAVSKKSLELLEKKLTFLAEHAKFDVNINSVLGGGINSPDDALVVTQRARKLGFSHTVGVIHDGEGQLGGFGP